MIKQRMLVYFALLILAHNAFARDYRELFDWVLSEGGEINAEIKVDSRGIRGLYAAKDLREDEVILSIPATTIINVGHTQSGFATPGLNLIREFFSPCTRFAKYIDSFPKPNEVLNGCNFPAVLVPMLLSKHWEEAVINWQHILHDVLTGDANTDLEYTLKEIVGNANVTFDDIKYACAVSSTRYVLADKRQRLIMAPIYDMANHAHDCDNYVDPYEKSPFMIMRAGDTIKKGEEICYGYGDMRDDYALVHYGFLPDPMTPPRLALVDTANFTPWEYSYHSVPAFEGKEEEIPAEIERLTLRHAQLKEGKSFRPPRPAPDSELLYTYDLLVELQERRITAIEYEIQRLEGLLPRQEL